MEQDDENSTDVSSSTSCRTNTQYLDEPQSQGYFPNDITGNRNVPQGINKGLSDKSNGKIYSCSKCQFICTKQICLEQHENIVHRTKPPYKCGNCEYHAVISSHFNKHVLSCNKDKPYFCRHCTFCCSQSNSLERHFASKHPETIIKCNKCDFSTYLQSQMDKHNEKYHSDLEKSPLLTCQYCQFICTKQVTLELHGLRHSTKPPYKCGQCEYLNANSGHFNYHILSCNKDKPYFCIHCHVGYYTSTNLQRHMKSKHQSSSSKD